ncbi:MAG: response regulator transcription factor [Microthrixaceae bacterium]
MRVLAVDDDPDLLLLYRVTLESQGHEVSEATSGRDALDMLRDSQFELVLLDMMLPELDGFGVLAELGHDRLTNELPVVIVSARIGIDDQIRGLESGAVAYLTKPFSIDRLQSLVVSIGTLDAEARRQLRRGAMVRLGSTGGDNPGRAPNEPTRSRD